MARRDNIIFGLLGALFVLLSLSYGWVLSQHGSISLNRSTRHYDNFRVVVDALPPTLSPVSGDVTANNVLMNVYEGLVKIDGFFRIVPGLAYSWGNVDEEGLLWEFKIRDNVRFHNGELMTVAHIQRTMEAYQAQKQHSEYVAQLLSSIDRFEYGDHWVRITTKYPDPLLLYRLSFLFILPSSLEDATQHAIGTGPYQLGTQTDRDLTLTAFEGYWGAAPAVRQAHLEVIPDGYARQQEFIDGSIDILLAVPAQQDFLEAVRGLPDKELLRIPSLELVYMMFNVKEFIGRSQNVLQDPGLREAIIAGINRTAIATIPKFAKVPEQYVASGVFGYDVQREPIAYDTQKTEQLLDGRYLTVQMALPQNFQLIGEAIRNSLEPLHITVQLELFDDDHIDEFLQGIADQRFQMYLVGTKYDIADSVEFFRSVVHSQQNGYGTLNGSGYADMELDDQIERAERILDQEERLTVLQQIQQKVLDEYLGLPLFEVDTVFAKKADIQWEPRMDGYMVLSEVR